MKKLILIISLPLTVITFAAFTKWWYVLPFDAKQTFYWGFPFAYVGESWQNSGALQFFILEALIDFMLYFLVCYGMVWIIFLLYKIKTVSKLLLKNTSVVINLHSPCVGINYFIFLPNIFYKKKLRLENIK